MAVPGLFDGVHVGLTLLIMVIIGIVLIVTSIYLSLTKRIPGITVSLLLWLLFFTLIDLFLQIGLIRYFASFEAWGSALTVEIGDFTATIP